LGPPEALNEMSNNKTTLWWNAYARAGTAEGTLVYANYGTILDFDTLDKMNISLNGTIVLVRYGYLWRGAKVYEAERRGAVGVIIYSDPAEAGAARFGQPEDDVHGWT
jgi:hypothetical protein